MESALLETETNYYSADGQSCRLSLASNTESADHRQVLACLSAPPQVLMHGDPVPPNKCSVGAQNGINFDRVVAILPQLTVVSNRQTHIAATHRQTDRPRCNNNITHTHTHPFNGPLSGTTRVSQYQKGKTNLDFSEARNSEWQWHRLDHMQVCTSLQTDNHANTPTAPVFYRPDALPAAQPTASKH